MKKLMFLSLCFMGLSSLAMEKRPVLFTKDELTTAQNHAEARNALEQEKNKRGPLLPEVLPGVLYAGALYAQYSLKQSFKNWTRTVAKRTEDTEKEVHILS